MLPSLLLPLLLLSLASADSVLDLTDADFDSKLADIDTALVMFYAPWSVLARRNIVDSYVVLLLNTEVLRFHIS